MRTRQFLGMFLTTGIAMALPTFSWAQDAVRERIDVSPDRREEPIRVQVGVNWFYPSPTADGEEASRLRERARRAV